MTNQIIVLACSFRALSVLLSAGPVMVLEKIELFIRKFQTMKKPPLLWAKAVVRCEECPDEVCLMGMAQRFKGVGDAAPKNRPGFRPIHRIWVQYMTGTYVVYMFAVFLLCF